MNIYSPWLPYFLFLLHEDDDEQDIYDVHHQIHLFALSFSQFYTTFISHPYSIIIARKKKLNELEQSKKK